MNNNLFNEFVKEGKNLQIIAKDKEVIVGIFKHYMDALIDTDSELIISLIDYENKNYKGYEDNDRFFPPIAHTKEDVIDMLDHINIMKNARIELFKKCNVKSIEEYNAKELNKMPYIFVFVDELNYLLDDEQIDKLLKLENSFNYLGIYLFMGATQIEPKDKPLDEERILHFCNTNCYVVDKNKEIAKSINEFKNYLFVEVETNGLDIDKDEIIKFSYVVVDNKLKIKKKEEFFVNTGNTIISKEVSTITGILQQDIEQGKDSKYLVDLLKTIINSNTLVMSYNLDFTIGFISSFLEKNNNNYILDNVSYLDILNVFRSSENLKRYRIKDAVKYYNILFIRLEGDVLWKKKKLFQVDTKN